MKKTVVLFFIAALPLSLTVTANPVTPSRSPRVYIMMKNGKLIEVNRGKKKLIKQDVTLQNLTTIHPNGAIDASSGQNLQLKEGEYITMDGRIRKLKDMYHPPVAKK